MSKEPDVKLHHIMGPHGDVLSWNAGSVKIGLACSFEAGWLGFGFLCQKWTGGGYWGSIKERWFYIV